MESYLTSFTNFQGAIAPMADFGAPPAHTEILLPLWGKHILSPKPPDDCLDNRRFPRRGVSDRRELSSYQVHTIKNLPRVVTLSGLLPENTLKKLDFKP